MMFDVNHDNYGRKAISTERPDYVGGVRATSKAAYRDMAPKLSKQHEAILATFCPGGVKTRGEIAHQTKLPTSTVSGRVNELIQMGKLKDNVGQWKCTVSGKKVRGVQRADAPNS